MARFFQSIQIKKLRGITLVESLVFLSIFIIVSISFLQTYSYGTRLIIESKKRLGATALANQKMEIIRSIAYDSIGTTTGIPSGSLLENEAISVNTTLYNVHTFVQYADDAFDGTVSSGDAIPTDYKRVRLTVSWGNQGTDQSVVIFGNFSPNGVESSTGGGVLSVNILDAAGSGVLGANVNIVNASAGVNVTGATDSTGNLTLPGAPAGVEQYVITISKGGYYGATTYPAYPTTAYNPVDVYGSVMANVLNQKTMVMDRASDITLTTRDPFGTAIPSIGYTMTGGRVLGTDPSTGAAVTGFSNTGSTNASGQASYPGESYGEYTITTTSANYEFWKLSPESASINKFTATAGVAANIDVILFDKNIGSLKVLVRDRDTLSPLAGASVHVTNAVLVYDATVTTDQYGYAYFPTTLPALLPGTYDITASLSGYDNGTTTADINATLQTKTIDLEAN